MTIGEMNRYIEIWRPSAAVDSENQPVGWELLKTKWAEIKGETGLRVINNATQNGGQINSGMGRYSMRVRYDRSIDTTMQVREHGVAYDIVAIRHDAAGRVDTFLICEQGGSNG